MAERRERPQWKRRPYQAEALKALSLLRFFILLWRRQGGKSSFFSEASLWAMMREVGSSVFYASASLLMGREIIYKQAGVVRRGIQMMAETAASTGQLVESVDRGSGKSIAGLNDDDWAEVFEQQRLEFRLYHDKTRYSRTQVIAPNPATARGWTGWVFIDEFGFIPDFPALFEAVEPIVSTDRTFHLIMATTPPEDDGHASYELTAPPIGSKWTPDPKGHWYRSDAGVDVHRVDIHDAYAAGVKLYDLRTGAELTPEQHFASYRNKDAWRRNYGLQHVLGGTSAVGLIEMASAQARGIDACQLVEVDSEGDFERAIDFLASHIDPTADVGLGWDLATTEGETSNPSSFTVAERHGAEMVLRLIVVWKTSDPTVAIRRAIALVKAVEYRRGGDRIRARRLCVDATNERYFARTVRDRLRPFVPVDLVVGSEKAPVVGDEPLNVKQWTCGLLLDLFDRNLLTAPPQAYFKEDVRLVKRAKGQFVCVPDAQGRHGDTFDSSRLAVKGLLGRTGPMEYERVRVAASPGGGPIGKLVW